MSTRTIHETPGPDTRVGDGEGTAVPSSPAPAVANASDGPAPRPIRTYAVKVEGYPEAIYSARSPGKARARCWLEYSHVDDRATFKDFLRISRVRRVADPPGVGRRIMVAGLPATTVHAYGGTHYVHFMRDDSDQVLRSHPADVTEVAP